jgi:hypothetical protein
MIGGACYIPRYPYKEESLVEFSHGKGGCYNNSSGFSHMFFCFS